MLPGNCSRFRKKISLGRRASKPLRLIIFNRYPLPGQTKTRLIPLLGSAGAADLQKRLTEKTCETARRFSLSRPIAIEICYANGNEKKMKSWLGAGPIYSRQAAGDIGRRMHQAFITAFRSGCESAVLIGTDIPGITEDLLDRAFSLLEENDVVVGPSMDGGYWLIGLSKPLDLFQNIQWSTGSVLKQTLNLIRKNRLTYECLEKLSDIDTERDLKQWSAREGERKPFISVIIPAFNESENISAAIQSAAHPDAEIIVVDGGSTDDTVKKAKNCGAQVITGPRGRARQQNVGAKRARGKVLLFLHADTLLPENYPLYVFDILMNSRVSAGAFTFKTDFHHPLMKLIELGANIRSGIFHLPYGDQGIFLRKSLFESLGGFPETAIAEDYFWVRKLSAHGKIGIVPVPAVTSGRRWKTKGPVHTWLINVVILMGCKMGISPRKLASLYRKPEKSQEKDSDCNQ